MSNFGDPNNAPFDLDGMTVTEHGGRITIMPPPNTKPGSWIAVRFGPNGYETKVLGPDWKPGDPVWIDPDNL